MNALTTHSITLFFPAHNEKENIENIVRTAVNLCPELSNDYEIIIVDDGSTDGTGSFADDLSEELPCVRVIHHEFNRGYGGALQSGFRAARNDLVFYTDADCQFDLLELRSVLPMIESSDVVTCFRQDRQDPWHRCLNTWLFEKAVFLSFGLKVRDPDCAFKIYRREVLESIELSSEGAMIDVEMLLQAQRSGYRIVQKGVRHLPRSAGTPSGGNVKVILRAMHEMWKLLQKHGSRFSPRKLPPAV